MATPDMTEMLQKRRQELLKELQAIDILLGSGQSKAQPEVTSQAQNPAPYANRLGYLSSRDENIALLREKTDEMSWKDYIHKAVKILGPSRSTAISDLIIDANDHKIPDSRVKDSVTSALTSLVKENRVNVKVDHEQKKIFFL